MIRRQLTVVLWLCCILSITARAQNREQPASSKQNLVLEINIVETHGAQRKEIDGMEAGSDQINRLISEGKARIIASMQVRAHLGESFSARLGERIPIQTATLPAIRTTARDPREPLQSGAAAGVPQIEYESTGLIVEGIATPAGEFFLNIRLKVETTGVDRSTGRLTPTFIQRTFSDVVRMKESETAILMAHIQPGGASLTLEQIAAGASNPSAGLVVLLTTKSVQ